MTLISSDGWCHFIPYWPPPCELFPDLDIYVMEQLPGRPKQLILAPAMRRALGVPGAVFMNWSLGPETDLYREKSHPFAGLFFSTNSVGE